MKESRPAGRRWEDAPLLPTSAGLVVNELQSRRAVALKANHHVLADVRAAAVVQETFVEI